MSTTKKVARSAIIIMVLTIVAKPFGFLRDLLMGAKFGSGLESDTYFLALSGIALFSGLLNKTINTTLIPVLSEVEKKEGKTGKMLHTNNFLNILILFSAFLMVLGFLFAPLLIKLMAPGFKSDYQVSLAILLLRIGLPTLVFTSVQGVLIGYLQSEGRFNEGAAIGIPLNIAFVTFLLFLSERFGIVGLMVTSVVASIFQVMYLVYGAHKVNYKHTLHLDLHDEYIKKILVLIPPVLISVGISDLNSIVDKSMGSTLIKGSISALDYAEKTAMLVRSIFISAITTVMYPVFASEATKDDKTNLKVALVRTINLILLITIPATIGMMILAEPIVRVAYERGKFDNIATIMTSTALVFTALRMATSSIRIMVNNVFYSLQDTKVPLYVGAFAVATNIIFNFILIKPMGHMGLALATTISSLFAVLLLVYILRKRIGSFGFAKSVEVGIKSLISASIMGVVVYFSYNYLVTLLGMQKLFEAIALFSSVILGVVIYFVMIHILKIDEVKWFLDALRNRRAR